MFRYIGLIELSKLQLVEVLYFYLPEFIMVCASTIIQQMLIKINTQVDETSDNFVEIADPESRATWQQTSSISIAISIGNLNLIYIKKKKNNSYINVIFCKLQENIFVWLLFVWLEWQYHQ